MNKETLYNFITEDLSSLSNLFISFHGNNTIHVINGKVRSISYILELNRSKEFYYIYAAQKQTKTDLDYMKLINCIGKIEDEDDLKHFITMVKISYELSR